MHFNNNTVEMTCAYEKDPYLIIGPDRYTKLSLPYESKKSLKVLEWKGEPIKIY